MRNRAGTLTPRLNGEAQYTFFVPTPLQKVALRKMDSSFLALAARTSHKLGVLDALSSRIPDIDLFISMYIRKESLLSSQIEGTQATLDDILDPAAEKNSNLNIAEVLNYIRAVHYAVKRLNGIPLCCRLLRETHEILLRGGRGSHKEPGEFRRSQNWLGPAGSTIKTAAYIPPAPEEMTAALGELEKFINSNEPEMDPLIKAGLIHYQFETIHPFLDGNGRIGRLLITLFLCNEGILTRPALYISHYLKLNRVEYFDRLAEVRRKGNYEQWLRFFITALHETADDALGTLDELSKLREKCRAKIEKLGKKAGKCRVLFDYLERSPIIDIGKTAGELKLSYNTVAKAASLLCGSGILRPARNVKRNRTFVYTKYLEILRRGTG